jgi:hypothetical protein
VPDAGIVPSAQADGKVRQLAGGTRVALLTHCGETGGTSAALGPGSLIRWVHRRRQWQRTCRALDAGIVPSASADGKVRQLALPGYSLE